MSATLTLAAAWIGCSGGDDGSSGTETPDSGTNASSSSSGDTSSSSSSSSSSSGSTSSTSSSGNPPNLCGNGTIDMGETCDDGNTAANDGCSATCTVEPGYACADAGATSCTPVCGNGLVQPLEACDLGAVDGGVGCSATCSIDLGFQCGADGGASTCGAVCGDGLKSGSETCDDGPSNGEPGKCNATCSGTKTPTCGDGRIQTGEGCDDGVDNGNVGKCAVGCPMAPVPMPAQTGTFTGNVRGYWFTAPKDFVITSLRVPTTASTAAQSIAVLRLPAAPPTFSATTNTFDTLFVVQSSAEDNAIAVKLPVSQNDIIVVLGQRGTTNSYSTGSSSDIDGTAVTLTRAGMQFPLTTTLPRDIWSESTGSNISRVDMTTARSQCGDGVKVKSEGCDDGNLVSGDGCSATCTVETGYACTEGAIGILTSTCTSTCGDMMLASNEACDDGVDNGTAGKCAADCGGFSLDVGAHATSSNAGTRGFWFTAPTAFVISGLRVPTDAANGDQAVQVVKLLAAPPTNGAATNAFQTLAYARAVAGTTVTRTRIAVAAGDRIGILGGRGAAAAIASSLTAAAVTSSVKAQALPLLPLAIDGSLDTGPASNLRVGTTAGAIGRIETFWSN